MGDRILFQVIGPRMAGHKTAREVGPVIYGHWAGDRAPDICARLQTRMIGRAEDVAYTSARLVQELIGDKEGNLGFGLWNSPRILTAKDTHGDAGIVLIDVGQATMRFQCLGGYLESRGDSIRVKPEA